MQDMKKILKQLRKFQEQILLLQEILTIFQGEGFKDYGLKPVAEYPKKIMSPAGEPVYVAEAWCYSHMVGNMKVKFDDKGVITELKAEPTIVLGDNFFEVKNEKGEKSQLQGKEKEDIIKFINSRTDLKFVKEDPTAQKVLERYKKEKERAW